MHGTMGDVATERNCTICESRHEKSFPTQYHAKDKVVLEDFRIDDGICTKSCSLGPELA